MQGERKLKRKVRCKEKEIQLENERKKGFEESERDSKEDGR